MRARFTSTSSGPRPHSSNGVTRSSKPDGTGMSFTGEGFHGSKRWPQSTDMKPSRCRSARPIALRGSSELCARVPPQMPRPCTGISRLSKPQLFGRRAGVGSSSCSRSEGHHSSACRSLSRERRHARIWRSSKGGFVERTRTRGCGVTVRSSSCVATRRPTSRSSPRASQLVVEPPAPLTSSFDVVIPNRWKPRSRDTGCPCKAARIEACGDPPCRCYRSRSSSRSSLETPIDSSSS